MQTCGHAGKNRNAPLKTRQTLKEQTAGGCQLIALLTAAQSVLTGESECAPSPTGTFVQIGKEAPPIGVYGPVGPWLGEHQETLIVFGGEGRETWEHSWVSRQPLFI